MAGAYQTKKTSLLFAGLPTVFVVSMTSAMIMPRHVNIFPAIVIAFIASVWCKYDALECGEPITQPYGYALFFLYPIMVPVYLLQSRGVRGIPALAFTVFYGLLAWAVAVVGFKLGT